MNYYKTHYYKTFCLWRHFRFKKTYEFKIFFELKKTKKFNEILVNSPEITVLSHIINFKEQKLNDFLPLVAYLLRIYLTAPVSSASAVGSFSCLKYLETYLRNTMGQNLLSNLALLSVNKELTSCVCIKNVIDTFASKNRKLQFSL